MSTETIENTETLTDEQTTIEQELGGQTELKPEAEPLPMEFGGIEQPGENFTDRPAQEQTEGLGNGFSDDADQINDDDPNHPSYMMSYDDTAELIISGIDSLFSLAMSIVIKNKFRKRMGGQNAFAKAKALMIRKKLKALPENEAEESENKKLIQLAEEMNEQINEMPLSDEESEALTKPMAKWCTKNKVKLNPEVGVAMYAIENYGHRIATALFD